MKAYVIKHNKKAKTPYKAYNSDAGFDLFSPDVYKIPAKSSIVIDTGIGFIINEFEIPKNYNVYIQIKGRSSLSINNQIEVCNAGVVDIGYRGSIKIRLYNNSDKDYWIHEGDRIAQAVFVLIPIIELSEDEAPDELLKTDRHINGIGSTGR